MQMDIAMADILLAEFNWHSSRLFSAINSMLFPDVIHILAVNVDSKRAFDGSNWYENRCTRGVSRICRSRETKANQRARLKWKYLIRSEIGSWRFPPAAERTTYEEMETTSVQRTMEFSCFQKDSLEKKFCRLNELKIKIFYLIEDFEAQRMNIIMLHYNLLGMLYKHFNFYLWIFDYSWIDS